MSLSFKMLKRTLRKAYTFLVLSGLVGIGFSLLAFFYVYNWEQEHAREDLEKQVDAHVRNLRQAFTTFGSILRSINGLHNVLGDIEQTDLARFVSAELLNYYGIHALEWISYMPTINDVKPEVVTPNGKSVPVWEWVDGHKQVVSQRPDYYPVVLTEPLAKSAQNLGYDLGSDVVLRTALEKARDQGQLMVSGITEVLTVTGKARGLRVFIPIYQPNAKPNTLTERRQQLVGFASLLLLVDEMIESIIRPRKFLNTSLFLCIFDKTPSEKIVNIYTPIWYERVETEDIIEIPLELAGRRWYLSFKKTSGSSIVKTYYAWIVLGIGLLFTIGLWRYLHMLLSSAHWAEDLAAKRTRSLSYANQTLNKEIGRREQITKALEISQQRFQAIFDEAAMGIVQTDLEGRILDCNKALQELLGYTEVEFQGCFLNDFSHPQDVNADQVLLMEMIKNVRNTFTISKRYHCKGGITVWTNQSCSIVRDANPPFIIGIIEDVTEQKCAEQARLEAEKKYRDIFENAVEGIFQCTPTGYFLSVNPAFVRIFGYDSAEQMLTEISNMGNQLCIDPQRRGEFIHLLQTYSKVQDFEYEALCRDGRMIWVNETVRIVRDEQGQVRYYEGIVEDITARKRTEEKLRYDATHDQLSGLLNRAAFTEYLTTVLNEYRSAIAARTNKQLLIDRCQTTVEFAVFFVDLDRFKLVNDSMGHLAGDKMLVEVAHRLCKSIRSQDIVARFGGDEFALMFENIADMVMLEKCIEQIQVNLNQPYFIEHETFSTTVSIGIALSSPHYTNANEILRDADTAMYEAKRCGRNKAVIFQPGMHTHVVNILRLESDLRKALDNEEFQIYYQPIISLEKNHTVGLEALVRWMHPERGMISPDQFIPVAEETGLIIELGLWVFETACKQLRRWQNQFPMYKELGMNINVSPIQLKQPRLVRQIQDIISKTGIKGPTCRIEITEGAMMHDPEAALKVLKELKGLEILLYVDDFGTGYSSLSYLQKFPLDALKIDKSFIREIDASGKSMHVTRAIIALGEAFNLKVVAEGVENDYQVSVLRTAHCHHVQGYFFSKPQDTLAIERYLLQGQLREPLGEINSWQ